MASGASICLITAEQHWFGPRGCVWYMVTESGICAPSRGVGLTAVVVVVLVLVLRSNIDEVDLRGLVGLSGCRGF